VRIVSDARQGALAKPKFITNKYTLNMYANGGMTDKARAELDF